MSGDFYFFDETKKKGQHHIYFAVVDCTGHGVPGALMSMMGNNELKGIIHMENETMPDIILQKLDKKIINNLNQKASKNRDGMDVSLVTIDMNSRKLYFSGAGFSFFYTKDQGIERIKGSRFHIGGLSKLEKVFDLHTLDLSESMNVYLTSDGYLDQIGGEGLKKFLSKRFIHMLNLIKYRSFETQNRIVDTTINEWMEGHKQLDDITVLGVKIDNAFFKHHV